MPSQFQLISVNIANAPQPPGFPPPGFPPPPGFQPNQPQPPQPSSYTFTFQLNITPGPNPGQPQGPNGPQVTLGFGPTNFQVQVPFIPSLDGALQQAKQTLSQYLQQWATEAQSAQL